MRIPGFSATAALAKSGRIYRSGLGQPGSSNNAGVQLAAIVRGGSPHCKGCLVCWGPFPYIQCICLYPCPTVTWLGQDLVAGPGPVAPGEPIEDVLLG